ncbi:MAG TPA: VWA domain-containing protein [Bacteroidia bacterium]|nr:VWA domain-containing protein [Bacteroidia bacterium]HNU32455.1 VWA domain-containing protein [Bacteroidia bacterium]
MRLRLKRIIGSIVCALLVITPCTTKIKAGASQLPVDIVFTLDLSASTNGLIDDVRDRIWDLANHLNSMRPAPDVRIGVIGYARPSFGYYNQFVKVICPLTNDIELLSNELYDLKPNIEKGDQFVGAAIRASAELMDWNTSPHAVKLVYLVGNGNAGTGNFDHREAIEVAVKKNIIINSLYCYSTLRSRDIAGWTEIADATGGELFDVKVHKIVPRPPTVYNRPLLIDLSNELNSTYIYYGKDGYNRYKMMLNNHQGTLKSGQSSFEAMLYYKISDHYQNKQADWDLVDCIKSRGCDLRKVDSKTLADSLRKQSPEQLRNYLETVKERRTRVINQLRTLLGYERQTILNKSLNYDKKQTELVIENVMTSTLNEKLSERGLKTPM